MPQRCGNAGAVCDSGIDIKLWRSGEAVDFQIFINSYGRFFPATTFLVAEQLYIQPCLCVCVSVRLCVCVSMCLCVPPKFLSQIQIDIGRRHQTSYDVARLLLMVPLEPWQNSTPVFGAAAFCTTKIDNFRASSTLSSLTTWLRRPLRKDQLGGTKRRYSPYI